VKFRFGYDIVTDLHHGFSLCVGRLYIGFHYNLPHLVYYNRHWAMDEAGYIQGMPVYRRKPKRWLIRGVRWPMKFEWVWLNS
jgi:hypothetical protein